MTTTVHAYAAAEKAGKFESFEYELPDIGPDVRGTITHQHGGFADRVRCHWGWATKIPDALNSANSGPLL